MIHKIVIVVLMLGAVGTTFIWGDSYRGRVVLEGRRFHGWCVESKISPTTAMHVTVRVGGICFTYLRPLGTSEVVGVRGLSLTGNLGFLVHEADRTCSVNAEHGSVERTGARLGWICRKSRRESHW